MKATITKEDPIGNNHYHVTVSLKLSKSDENTQNLCEEEYKALLESRANDVITATLLSANYSPMVPVKDKPSTYLCLKN